MKTAHRRWHVRLWLILGPLVILGVVVGLALRRPVPITTGGGGETAAGEVRP